jgi:dihydrofolate synthase / folylpolyglutamate synthase
MVKMPHWPVPIGSKPIDLGLSRIKSLLEALDNPQNKLPPIIHVAGTNGKGSTTAFLKAIFQAAGYKVHTYTSPHLVRFNERIGILGSDIDDRFLYEVTEECRIAAENNNIHPTFFEGTTAVAFLAFSKRQADILIVEVGLGGRLDATNVIDHPIMSVITSISLDHTEFLGKNIENIAYEKGGIIKSNCSCVISQQYPEAMEVLHSLAEKYNSSVYSYEYDWIIDPDKDGMVYKSKEKTIKLPMPNLQGIHQCVNAGNAITAVLNLKEFNINDEHIAYGITHAVLPARLQKLTEGNVVSKLPDNMQIWVDGAHNDSGAHVLSLWLEEQEKIPTYMIFGMTRGRDCLSFLSPFVGRIKHLAGVLIEAEPSSYSGEFVRDEALKLGITSSSHDSIDDALYKIIEEETSAARIIVCGSLYLAGDVLSKNQGLTIK